MVQAGRVSMQEAATGEGTDPTTGTRLPLPLKAGETTPDRPWPVRHLAPKIADYIARMPPVWVEGQILNFKRWNNLWFLTLRDTDLDMSLSVTAPAGAIGKVAEQLQDGSHIVIHARPQFHAKKGTLSFSADDVRLVGLDRSEERRVGKECPVLCRSRWSPSRRSPSSAPGPRTAVR